MFLNFSLPPEKTCKFSSPCRYNLPVIEISPLRPDQVDQAKHLIYSVAHELFHERDTFAESVAWYESRGQLRDVEDFQASYIDGGGVFFTLVDEGRLIGTGALRLLGDGAAEVKRLWLLPEYHGRGLGYRLLTALLQAARARGCQRVRLETDAEHQTRARAFYRRVGFYEIPPYSGDPHAVALELRL